MSLPIYHVDAFTDRPFGGNPAAVCLLSAPQDEVWMLLVAREMNLSETAFVYPEGQVFRLRWFTPAVEVELCGHATLATAHVLWETGRVRPDQVIPFTTLSGVLKAARQGEMIDLDFPLKPVEEASPPDGLAGALGAEILWVGRNLGHWLVEVGSEEVLGGVRPDMRGLARLLPVRGLIVTTRPSTAGYDFVSRYFAPAVGVPEDPVTGSAHCCLADYWGRKLGKSEMVGYQASARGGVVRVRVAGGRVFLGGQAVTVLRGELLVG
ncbi:MAG: PhzF family phenazine biosynthesis protein [Gemmataceae bacterium]|nr:PhzF family phenazine biosynthesis protein [Gemmataceae bacterium]